MGQLGFFGTVGNPKVVRLKRPFVVGRGAAALLDGSAGLGWLVPLMGSRLGLGGFMWPHSHVLQCSCWGLTGFEWDDMETGPCLSHHVAAQMYSHSSSFVGKRCCLGEINNLKC